MATSEKPLEDIVHGALTQCRTRALRGAEVRLDHVTMAEQTLMEGVVAYVEQEKIRARDELILELVTGYDGIRGDLQKIEEGAKSLGKKASGFAVRLSVIQAERSAAEGQPS